MYIVMFILCNENIKCSLDYYVLHVKQLRKCWCLRHEFPFVYFVYRKMRFSLFFIVEALLIFLPLVVQTLDSAFYPPGGGVDTVQVVALKTKLTHVQKLGVEVFFNVAFFSFFGLIRKRHTTDIFQSHVY